MYDTISPSLTDKVASLIPNMMPSIDADACINPTCETTSSGDYYCYVCYSLWHICRSSCYTFYY